MTRVSRRAEDFNFVGRAVPCAPSSDCVPAAGKGLPALPLAADFFAMRRVCAGNPAASILAFRQLRHYFQLIILSWFAPWFAGPVGSILRSGPADQTMTLPR